MEWPGQCFFAGFRLYRSNLEHCVYTKVNAGLLTIIDVYVDNFFIFSNDVCEIDCLKSKISCEFRLQDLGQAKQILGMKVTRNRDAIILDQTDYNRLY